MVVLKYPSLTLSFAISYILFVYEQVEEESMELVYRIEKIGSRSGAPSARVEITDSGVL